ncbi:MAG: cystathionine gamma-synthase family protein [Planctomycetes bacterium]|nr:cystathionine gamma-synthase family protein [Planctomycetota bacterium]
MKRRHHRRIGNQPLRPESLMMSYGYDPQLSEGAIKSPIFMTSTFVFKTAGEGKRFFEVAYGLREQRPREELGLIYSRLNNPDTEILEDRLAVWDGAEACATFASGMAATATTFLALLRPGDVVLHSVPVYGGTDYLLDRILPAWGVRAVGFLAKDGVAGMQRAITELGDDARHVALIHVETPANPTNDLVDIAAAAKLARELTATHARTDRPVRVAVDNTFLGPLWQQPLAHGADVVIYSATKFIGGHSDVIAGAVLGSKAMLEPIRTHRTILGTMCGPWTAWLLMRSLETLKLRMTSAMKNARYVADFLADHPKVTRVHYLGHLQPDDPQHEVFQRQCRAPGSMIAFEVAGGEAEAFRVLDALQMVKLAVSLGGTESLAEHPATMTHSDIAVPHQLAMGIVPAMIRLSVGIEHPEDTIADLRQALDAM